MDRTEASDAFNAGSIPVGHIPPPLQLLDSEVIMKFKSSVKLLIPVCVILIVAVSVAAALITREDAIVANETATSITTEETISAISADNPLEGDKIPELNELVLKYLNALADGDVDTISSITNNMTDIERIRVTELGKYIDAFPEYNVFSKIGPVEGSYIVYAAARAKFPGIDEPIPGIYCFYVCTDDQGKFYFNEGTLTEEEQIYIDAINADESVIDLMESIDEEYKAVYNGDEKVRNFIDLMQSEIRGAVGTALASAAAETAAETESTESAPEDPTILHKACEAVTTATINVRASDSESADKLGTISKGTTLDVIEIRVNGWAKISYQGKDAYLKTDYLDVLEEPDEAGTGENVANGTVVTTTTVNVRSEASTDSNRIGQVTGGTKLDWIADVEGGFSKIIFDGKVGYIKSDYLTKQ